MNTGTLIDVVAMLDTRIANLEKIGNLYLNKKIYVKHEEYKARAHELQMLSDQLQIGVDADIASIEQ